MGKKFLGEFEHMVLLAVLRLEERAFGPEISKLLEECAGRQVSRGALYATLERLGKKGYLRWAIEAATSERGGNRRRRFQATPAGVEALKASRQALQALWQGMDDSLTRTSQ